MKTTAKQNKNKLSHQMHSITIKIIIIKSVRCTIVYTYVIVGHMSGLIDLSFY